MVMLLGVVWLGTAARTIGVPSRSLTMKRSNWVGDILVTPGVPAALRPGRSAAQQRSVNISITPFRLGTPASMFRRRTPAARASACGCDDPQEMLSMLDLRRTAAPLRAARMAALAAALTLSFLLSPLRRPCGIRPAGGLRPVRRRMPATPFNDAGAGRRPTRPTATRSTSPTHRRELSSARCASTTAPAPAGHGRRSRYGNAAGLPGRVVALAVDADPAHRRVYALIGAKRHPDPTADHRRRRRVDGASLAFSTPQSPANRLVAPATAPRRRRADRLPDRGRLGRRPDRASPSTPTTHQVAIIGVDGPTARVDCGRASSST